MAKALLVSLLWVAGLGMGIVGVADILRQASKETTPPVQQSHPIQFKYTADLDC